MAVLSLFVWAQTATLLHAEIHPFHQHTAECDIYQYLGQPSAASSDTVPLAETVWISQQLPVLAPSYPLVAYQTVYWGRAPPQA
ncbi:hypothetical protein QCB44_07845 [Thiomicrorhabdus sp. zzn3]|uniref:hypothetical protein n=1 Tax=Thiomicrorhabdus sp. zzn3 TaxID=3039775 RepID=UPI002436E03B|nr:hypothetical protein [Thiomicrorhabdus sp. zzn3]MDG6778614.1 hypothetical protein [Thiomicrorhabdus sp. zzn3]